MSAVMRLRLLAGVLTTSGATLVLLNTPSIRAYLSKHLPSQTAKYLLRSLLLLFAWLNVKNLPFFWHIRVFRGILYQLYFQSHPQKPKHLFAPLITSSYTSIWETDYNFHKSNSTYFADLDVARAHYVGCIIRTGLTRLNKGDEEGLPGANVKEKGTYIVALGGVSCFFRRQIEPLQQFEIFTRLLSWDRKWLYTVSHIVKKGAIKPSSYVLQPGRKSRRRQSDTKRDDVDPTKFVYATSVARYVFKKGRLTINPEIVLERSRLLPPRPSGISLPPRAEAVPAQDAATPEGSETTNPQVNGTRTPETSDITLQPSEVVQQSNEDLDDWTWDDMEAERLRGLDFAKHFDALSAVQDDLKTDVVLGQYGDYW